MPALVVPAVATTPTTSARGARRVQRGTERLSGEAVVVDRHGQRAHAEHAECLAHRGMASSLIATSGRSGASPPRRGRAVSRATISAERFPAEPPATKQPRRLRGAGLGREHGQRLVLGNDHACCLQPRGAVQRRARHEHVEEEGGLRGRGGDEREEPRAVTRHDGGANFSTKSSSTAAASLPSGRMRPPKTASSDSTRPPKSSDTGSIDRRSRQASTMRSVMPSS